MFKCYIDNLLFFDDKTPLISKKVMSPSLKLSDSNAGSFECTVPTTNEYYNYILEHKNRGTIRIECYGEEIFEGRLTGNKSNFQNYINIYAEGALAYLNDTIQPAKTYKGQNPVQILTDVIRIHNTRVDASRTFAIGRTNFNKMSEAMEKFVIDYETTLDVVNSFVSNLDMHVRVRKENGTRYLDFIGIGENQSDQIIEFGKNLSDFSKDFDFTDIATVIIPLGKARASSDETSDTDEKLTIASVNNGSIYLEASQAVLNTYGRIEKKVDWSDVEDATKLKQLGQEYLNKTQYEELTINVSAIDLQALYGNSYRTLKVLDAIRVKSKPHGLDAYYNITEINYKLDQPDKTTFTLGNNKSRNLTSINNDANNLIMYEIDSIASQSTILRAAKENASNAIRTNTSGYVTLVMDDDADHVQEIVITNVDISDLATWKTDPNVHGWRWNQSGLGYFGNGFNEEVSIAMTGADGGLVANCITTGYMAADRIKGGLLTLGGGEFGPYGNGAMIVYDSNGNVTGVFDTDGVHIYQGIIESSHNNYWVKISDGYLYGNYGNQERSFENSAGAIRFGQFIDDQYAVMEILAGNGLFLNATTLWLGDGTEESTAYEAYSGSVEIETLGYIFYLDFMNGILVNTDVDYNSGTYDASATTLVVDDLWFDDGYGNQVSIRDFEPGGGSYGGLNGLVRVLTQSDYSKLDAKSPSILYAIATSVNDNPTVEVIYQEDYEALVDAGEVDSHTLYVLI